MYKLYAYNTHTFGGKRQLQNLLYVHYTSLSECQTSYLLNCSLLKDKLKPEKREILKKKIVLSEFVHFYVF